MQPVGADHQIEDSPDWRERLEITGRLMWTVFRRHPWAAEVLSMTRPQFMPNLIIYAEWSLSALRQLGFGIDDMMHTHLTPSVTCAAPR